MKAISNKNTAKGFSLVELLLVLTVIAGLGIAAFVIYPRVNAGRQATFEGQVLSAAQAGIKGLYPSGDYAALTPTVANQADFFPASMQATATTLATQFGQAATVAGSTNVGVTDAVAPAAFFKIQYDSVPAEVCTKLAASAAQKFGAVYIGGVTAGAVGTTAIKNDFTGVALAEGAIPGACSNAGAATAANMTFVAN